MKLLCEFLGKEQGIGDLGVEIETEGRNLSPDVPAQVWKTEDDGSLRGRFPTERAEYVLRKPLPLQGVEKALTVLNKAQEKSEAKLDFSFRTSVHVHLNVLGLNENQVSSLMYLYLLFEPVMMRYCGPQREGNRFCLRLEDAEQLLLYVTEHIQNGFKSSTVFAGDRCRYAAMNLASIGKYGSIEFRGMRGTMDGDVLLPWCRVILSLRNNAVKYNSLLEIHQELEKYGVDALAAKVFGEDLPLFWHDNAYHDVARAYSLSYEVVLAARRKEEAEKRAAESRKRIAHIAIKNGMKYEDWILVRDHAVGSNDNDLYRQLLAVKPAKQVVIQDEEMVKAIKEQMARRMRAAAFPVPPLPDDEDQF